MKNIKNYNDFVNEGSETSGTIGSGMNVSGGAQGSFTSSAGVAVYGGNSGTAFATNSNSSGMGGITSSQPSNTPGSVWGSDSTKGSGDVSKGYLGPYTKLPSVVKRKKGKKRKTDYAQKGAEIDKFYTSKYMEKQSNGKLITTWNVFKEKYNNE